MEKNEEKAREMLELSSQQGNVVALARQFRNGWGKEEDSLKSFHLLEEHFNTGKTSLEKQFIGFEKKEDKSAHSNFFFD